VTVNKPMFINQQKTTLCYGTAPVFKPKRTEFMEKIFWNWKCSLLVVWLRLHMAFIPLLVHKVTTVTHWTKTKTAIIAHAHTSQHFHLRDFIQTAQILPNFWFLFSQNTDQKRGQVRNWKQTHTNTELFACLYVYFLLLFIYLFVYLCLLVYLFLLVVIIN